MLSINKSERTESLEGGDAVGGGCSFLFRSASGDEENHRRNMGASADQWYDTHKPLEPFPKAL